MNKTVHILFLCVANSVRSQMAEGIAKSIFGEHALVESAGSKPSGKVHPMAIEVLKEKDIDISYNWSKPVAELSPAFIADLDFVVTLCFDEVCPILPSKAQRLHWAIPDPSKVPESKKAEAFRKTREDLKTRISALFNQTKSRN